MTVCYWSLFQENFNTNSHILTFLTIGISAKRRRVMKWININRYHSILHWHPEVGVESHCSEAHNRGAMLVEAFHKVRTEHGLSNAFPYSIPPERKVQSWRQVELASRSLNYQRRSSQARHIPTGFTKLVNYLHRLWHGIFLVFWSGLLLFWSYEPPGREAGWRRQDGGLRIEDGV